MAKDFSNLMRNNNLHIQKVQQTPSRTSLKKSTTRHIIVKLWKDKDKGRLLTTAKEK